MSMSHSHDVRPHRVLHRTLRLLLVVPLLIVVVACGGAKDPGTSGSSPGGDEARSWQTLEVLDVAGRPVRIADLVGKPVFVETFATWCPTCRSQLGQTEAAAAALGDDAIVLALSVETTLPAASVATYAKENGFANIRFAVMTPEMLASFVTAFGNRVANPPSTPHLVINAAGQPGDFNTGRISADAIIKALRSPAPA
jgi:thiol-disulfide isomerase/thioredoxin